MEQKNSKIFDKKNIQIVSSFCLANNIEDVNEFIYRCFKEVIVEKEIIKEVPVEKIVTKVEYISDKTGETELIGKIKQLEQNIFNLNEQIESERKIFSTKTEEMENNFHYEITNKDKDLDELRRNLDIKLDDTQTKLLQETLQKLRKELLEKNKKIENLEKINENLENKHNPLKAVFMKGSNLRNNL
jgi:predicted RNase H-like nuclease (RuvC/YqgF family)